MLKSLFLLRCRYVCINLAFGVALLSGYHDGVAGELTRESKAVLQQQPTPAADRWEFKLGSPGWIAGVDGVVGIDGVTSDVDISAAKIFRKIDMVASLSAEARKGRFGAYADVLYLSLSDGIGITGNGMGRDSLVSKLDVRLDQYITNFDLSYRVIQGPRGWVDVLAGFRYVNIYQALRVHPNNVAINDASTQLVDRVSNDIGGAIQDAIAREIDDRLLELANRRPVLPIGPLGGRVRDELSRRIFDLIETRRAELAAAIAAADKPRIDAIKAELQQQIAQSLGTKLDQRVARDDQWVDPYLGVRARLNLTKAFYATTKADVGGFGVGSDLTWQVYGALGCQVTRKIWAEAGYKHLYIDYRKNGLIYDASTGGAQITAGLNF